jgi:GNAT superfamily N-acetyltransferase
MHIHQIANISDIDFVVPTGFSFFEPYIKYNVKEILEIGGEAYATKTPHGDVSGIFIYDNYEKGGTIYTRSREIFDHFYQLKPFNFLFSEIQTEIENETYDIYTLELEKTAVTPKFSYEISVAKRSQIDEIEKFMASTHPGINKKWVNVALKNEDKCFFVRLNNEIVGAGWLSLVNDIGRLHTLYVRQQFRRLGIGEDILNARLLWLKSKRARLVFTEISRYNVASAGNVMKAHMTVSGQVFQYFKKNLDKKNEQKIT